MNYDGTPYGDLIDSTPVIGTADRLVSRCRDAARSADRGRYSTADLHDWAVERYEARDDLVRMATNALFARDCIWGVADLDHPTLDRYAWELAGVLGRLANQARVWFACREDSHDRDFASPYHPRWHHPIP